MGLDMELVVGFGLWLKIGHGMGIGIGMGLGVGIGTGIGVEPDLSLGVGFLFPSHFPHLLTILLSPFLTSYPFPSSALSSPISKNTGCELSRVLT